MTRPRLRHQKILPSFLIPRTKLMAGLAMGLSFFIGASPSLYAKKHSAPPHPLPIEHVSHDITQQAITDLSQAMKEGGMDEVVHTISGCYLNAPMGSDLRKKCILEDLALRIFDQRFRAIIEGQTGHDPGPAVTFLADQATEMRNTLYIYPLFKTAEKAGQFYDPALPATINALTHSEKQSSAEKPDAP